MPATGCMAPPDVAVSVEDQDFLARFEAWTGFAERIDDLLDRNAPILLRYYSKERLFSDAARHAFIEADIKPLPPLNSPD